MSVIIDRDWRVAASRELVLPLSAAAAWGQMRDFARFIAIDPLHTRVRVGPPVPGRVGPAGRPLVIPHRFLGLGPDRVGRVLRWEEGRGFAFSDLSRRGPRAGFPHICAYALRADGPGRCCLTVSARGVWTARWIPRWAAACWIWWVLLLTEAQIQMYLGAFARWRRQRNR
jgi:hypothetical protein